MTQLKLFSEQTLERMVDDGRLFMSKKFLEWQRKFPRQVDMSSYTDKLIMHDISRGYLEMPNISIVEFDQYIKHIKNQCDNDVYEIVKRLKFDLEDMFELKYSPNRLREMYAQLTAAEENE